METLLVLIFTLGYLAIVFEHSIHVNKTASALFTGTSIWAVYALTSDNHELVNHELLEHLGDISSILFFLLGAMTIVELVDTFHGFDIITDRLHTRDKRTLLLLVSFITFFMSSILDNLTTTIVMITLLRKLIPNRSDRMLMAGMVVIAANAGGAFSPIGDVTTTMLWIGGQISTNNIVLRIFLPALVSMAIPMVILSFQTRGTLLLKDFTEEKEITRRESILMLTLGVGSLMFVPAFKLITHLPPYMGMLFMLSILWATSELLGLKKSKEAQKKYSIYNALTHLDLPTVLFFMGILLAVAGLQTAGVLADAANALNNVFKNETVLVTLIGLLSSIVDNVPLVAAAMGMYSLEQYPMDSNFWELLAYCAGTGGSALIIGSAAGVAVMGMEKITFFWYLKNISWLALIGYFAGIGVFLLFQ